jgi:hypothetical protein
VKDLSPWSIETSFFKEMLVSKETYRKCLGSDFNYSRIQNFIKLPRDQTAIKDTLTIFYPQLIEVYKHIACKNVKNGNVFMNYNELLGFLTETGVIDERTFRKVDYDVIFKAVNYTELENTLNPTYGVVRYEFIETLVRVAIEKYFVKRTVDSEQAALEKLFALIVPHLDKFDGNFWRRTRYFTENMEIVFKTYLPVFQRVYDKYKDTDGRMGSQAHLDQENFYQMCMDIRLF